MTTETGYNGWTNYETWAAALHINNEEGTQANVIEWALELIEDDDSTPDETTYSDATIDLADRIKGLHEEMMPEVQGVFADLLNAALGAIEWREIADGFIRSAKAGEYA